MDMAEAQPNLRRIFDAALEIEDPEQRRDFVAHSCAGDARLRREVEELLAAHETAGGFLADPARSGLSSATPSGDGQGEGTVIGRYRLRQKLGEGGCGVVYLAEQQEPVRRRVALKILKLGMDTRAVIARFEAERQALAMMEHPNIARVLDAGATDSGRPFFVMELVRGIRITDYCDQHTLSTRDRLRLFAQVCHAVQHAHQKGIIHRDLKPSNILVAAHDGGALPKIIDFGIAKATGSQPLTDKTVFTQFEMFLGTPAYMSPEQADFNVADIDTRTDIYALGVLLYELLTGRTPFDTETLLQAGFEAMRRAICETEPARPSTRLHLLRDVELAEVARRRQMEPPRLVSQVRGDLDWIVLKALAKDRTRRYETANALALDVQRHLSDEPILARPPSARDAVGKWMRRHRASVAALASITVFLIAGITFSNWQWLRARAAERAQRDLREQAESARERAERENYFSTIGVAGKFIDEGQTERARDLLLGCPPRFRHWEWGRLMLLCHAAARTLPTGQGAMHELAFSRDNSLLVSRDAVTARVWDLGSGRLRQSFTNLPAPIRRVRWSAQTNELWLLAGDGTVHVWDIGGDRERLTLPDPGIRFLVVNPAAPQVLTAGPMTRAAVWNASTGRREFELEGAQPGSVGECFFSPDGSRIIAVNQDFRHVAGTEVARVWDAHTGREQARLQAPADQWVGRWAWLSPDGGFMASIHGDGTLRVWDAMTGRLRFSKLGRGLAPRYAIISPDARTVGAYGDNGTIRLWSAATGDELSSPNERAYHIQFTTDGGSYVTSGGDRVARVWTLAGGEPLVLRGHGAFVGLSTFSPDGRLVACAADDGVVRVWSLRAGREALPASDWAEQVAFSPDGRSLVSSHFDLQARIWDVATGAERLRLLGHRAVVNSAVFSPDSRRILTGSYDRTAKLWEAQGGRELFTLRGHARGIQRVAISPDNRFLATASWDRTARIWAARDGRELATLTGHGAPLRDVTFSPDSRWIATAGADGTARVWDVASGQSRLVLSGHRGVVGAVAFSPDGRTIVTGGADRTLRFWDPGTGALRSSLTGRTRIHSLAFSADGRRLFTASTEPLTSLGHPSVEVWEPEAGRELLSLPGREAVWSSVAVSPDGLRLASGGTDNEGKLREAFPWQDAEWASASGSAGAHRLGDYAEAYWQERLAAERQGAPGDTNRWTASRAPRAWWPARADTAPAGTIDLTPHYNGWLDVAWLPPRLEENLDNDLAELPRGLVTLDGIPFDLRGVVQLAGSTPDLRGWFPSQVTNIVVGRMCRRLQFVHADTFNGKAGILVGRYVLHFADGRRFEHELRHQRDFGPWLSNSQPTAPAPVVWSGDPPAGAPPGTKRRLYRLALENPFLDTPARIDFVSDLEVSAPFLVALTVE